MVVLGGGLIAGVLLVLQPEIFNPSASVLQISYACGVGDCRGSYCEENGGVCSGTQPNCSCLIKSRSKCTVGSVSCLRDRVGLKTCVGGNAYSLFECPYGCSNG